MNDDSALDLFKKTLPGGAAPADVVSFVQIVDAKSTMRKLAAAMRKAAEDLPAKEAAQVRRHATGPAGHNPDQEV